VCLPSLLDTYCLVSFELATFQTSSKREDSHAYTKLKLISPCILAFNSNSRSKFKPICNLTGLVSDDRGRAGAFVEARPGPSALFGFLFRRRRRRIEDEEPALEDMSDSSSWRRRSSIMASFDMSLGKSGIVFGEVASLVGILGKSSTVKLQSKATEKTKIKKQETGQDEDYK